MITPYTDAHGRPRGTLNLLAACNAPPDSDDRKITRAYMGSPDSGYSIIYLPPARIHITSSSSVNIGEYTLQKQGSTWQVTSPPPRHGASGEFISICGSNQSTWDAQRWTQASTDMPHDGIICASGWAKWGNVLRPLSRTEQKQYH